MMQSFSVDALTVEIYPSAAALSEAAADQVLKMLQPIVAVRLATVVFATGRSPLGLLQQLRDRVSALDWSRVIGLHLDEYLGIDPIHAASFQHYLQEQVATALPLHAFHYLNSQALEPIKECNRYADLLDAHPLDLCLLGVGNNGHLAFNDPAVANIHDRYPVKLVRLDPSNRQQQLSSGTFTHLEQVPGYAYTLTLPTIFSAQHRLCLALGEGKAPIIRQLLRGEIGPACPASLLRTQVRSCLLLDAAAASAL